jgi:3-hydroxypropanoate dehydrogenase
MARIVNDNALDILFRSARSHIAWIDRPVSDTLLRAIWELTKLGPTRVNCSPARILFVKSPKEKQRLAPALAEGDLARAVAAPVTALVGYDLGFCEQLPRLFPRDPNLRSRFAGNDALIRTTALRNASLQGAYLIIAARALGLDSGPLFGFDNAIVDAAFFPDGKTKSNFLCNLGYGDSSKLHPRNPRLDFDEACRIL